MGLRTSRTSPDMSVLSGGHLTGQDKVPLCKGTCLSECPSTWNFYTIGAAAGAL